MTYRAKFAANSEICDARKLYNGTEIVAREIKRAQSKIIND